MSIKQKAVKSIKLTNFNSFCALNVSRNILNLIMHTSDNDFMLKWIQSGYDPLDPENVILNGWTWRYKIC